MGEAKKRGTFEERQRCAIEADKILKQCYPMKWKREAFIAQHDGSKVNAAFSLVNQMIQKQRESKLPPAKDFVVIDGNEQIADT